MWLLTGLISGAGGVSATNFQLTTGYFSELYYPPLVLLSLSLLPFLSGVIAYGLRTDKH